ncbi:MAG: hypothetical protein ACREF3_20820, partial [Acetobacteraceae bacterium]
MLAVSWRELLKRFGEIMQAVWRSAVIAKPSRDVPVIRNSSWQATARWIAASAFGLLAMTKF